MPESTQQPFREKNSFATGSKKKIIAVSLIIIFLIGVLTVVYVLTARQSKAVNNGLTSPVSNFINDALPASTPLPFFEITIPGLRERNYQSKLSDLQTVSQNGGYTSYLTSNDSDGLDVFGQLTVPSGNQPIGGWPAIVFIHGYLQPSQYQTLVNYNSYVDVLAGNGFVVFKIDLRGHAQSEGEPGGAYYSEDYVVDALNAYSALQSAEFVNREKVGFWGHSMAGNVVFRSFVVNQKIPAIVIWAGAGYTYSDLSEFGIDDNSYRPPPTDSPGRRKRQRLIDAYGAFSPESEFWKQVVPTNYLKNVGGSVQLNHAVDDNVVSIQYSRNLVKILSGSDINSELNEYQSGGHNLTGPTFNQAMDNTVRFFKEKLGTK